MLAYAQIFRTWTVGVLFAILVLCMLAGNSAHARGYRHYKAPTAKTYHVSHRRHSSRYAYRHGLALRYVRYPRINARAVAELQQRPNFFQQAWGQMTETVRSTTTMVASWYGGGEKLASHTANGERFNPGGLTVAHRSLPMGTRLRISHNGRSAVCRVNDRGPAAWTGRSIDLARGCARAIGMNGISRVQVAVLGR